MEKTKKLLERDAQQITDLLQRCVDTAYVTRTSPAWQAFLAYIDTIIQTGKRGRAMNETGEHVTLLSSHIRYRLSTYTPLHSQVYRKWFVRA